MLLILMLLETRENDIGLAQEHNRSTFFPAAPKSLGSWHRGQEHAMVLEYTTTEL